jgi:hypothetical protein
LVDKVLIYRFNVIANLMEEELKISPGLLRDKWNIKIQKKDLMKHVLETQYNRTIKNDESFLITIQVENKEDERNLVDLKK